MKNIEACPSTNAGPSTPAIKMEYSSSILSDFSDDEFGVDLKALLKDPTIWNVLV